MTFIVIIFVVGIMSRTATALEPITKGCGGNRTEMSGTIASPNYGSINYPSSFICKWMISVPPDMVIEFRFQSIDLEDELHCTFDGVVLYDNHPRFAVNFTQRDDVEYLGKTKFCGNKTYPVIISKTNEVGVAFYSDSNKEETGFQLKWKAVPDEDSFNCTFDQGLCKGWTNTDISEDQFGWTVNKMSTPSDGTGPFYDHTLQNDYGAYMFIETSSPQKTNDLAFLVSPPIWFDFRSSTACVSFWYHMYGLDVGSLLVRRVGLQYKVIWAQSGEVGREWMNGRIEIQNLFQPTKLEFIGIRGSGFQGDIALDDVAVTSGSCKYYTRDFNDQESDLTDYFVPITGESEISPPPPPPIGIICQSDAYRCISGRKCISRKLLCDDSNDCPDGDDELVCACPYSDDIRCGNGTCIASWFKCDGVEECEGGKDEEDCESEVATKPTNTVDAKESFIDENSTDHFTQNEKKRTTTKPTHNHSEIPFENPNKKESDKSSAASSVTTKPDTDGEESIETTVKHENNKSTIRTESYQDNKKQGNTKDEEDEDTVEAHTPRLEPNQNLSPASNNQSVTAWHERLNKPTKPPAIKQELTTSGSATDGHYSHLTILQVAVMATIANFWL